MLALDAARLPAIFPIKNSRSGSLSPVSVADKLRLLRYGYQNRLTQSELARLAGVSQPTIGKWKREVEQEKGRRANRLDQKRLALVGPSAQPLVDGADDLKTREGSVAKAPAPAPVPTLVIRDGLPTDKHHSAWTREERLALVRRQAAEKLSNKQTADLAGTHTPVITAWRKEFGYSGRRCTASSMSAEDRVALLELQREENLTNAQAADLAGVHVETITEWRREFGFEGKRGDGPRRWDAEQQRAWLAAIEAGDMTVHEVADAAGTTRVAVYQWRARERERARAEVARFREVSLTRPDGTKLTTTLSAEDLMRIMRDAD